MHRQWLLDNIERYADKYPAERETVERFQNFIAAHEDCFERSCVPGHITGSAWVLDPVGEKTLLTHHRKLNMWIQLGGHSDGDPNALNVALREAEEESGLEVAPVNDTIFDLDVHLIPERKGEPAHHHYDVRFLLQAKSDAFVVSDESHALAWVGAQELKTLTDEESMLRMLDKWSAMAA